MRDDDETGVVMYGVIMKLESTIQPISRDEVFEMGETLDERTHWELRNSCHHDRRHAQEREREQAEQDARLQRENPLLARNLYPNIAQALNTPSEVGGVLAQIANGLPRTPDVEGYRQVLTKATNHLLPLAYPPNDLPHAINIHWDAQSNINASRDSRHEDERRRREE
jgi:hypothetical protein